MNDNLSRADIDIGVPNTIHIANPYLIKYIYILSNERSLALNDTDNRAEKGSLENKKIPSPGLVRFHGRGTSYQLGIGSAS